MANLWLRRGAGYQNNADIRHILLETYSHVRVPGAFDATGVGES